MKPIINSIDELRKTVKVSASLKYDVVEPFLQTARDFILIRYLGLELVEILEEDETQQRAEKLLQLTKLTMGPLAIWFGNAELSVRISDSGFTVEKNAEKFLPASDAKIGKVEESLERRGFQYLDQVLEYLETNAADFPEWTNSRFYTLRGGNYIKSATQFQEIGLVDINDSRLTFESFRPLMSLIEERFITELLGDTLSATLQTKPTSDQTVPEKALIGAVCKFVACKTAELHTSQASKKNREGSGLMEYKPLIRPIYSDPQNEGNFFAEQAIYYFNKLQQTLQKYAVELGVEPTLKEVEFNKIENRIYNMMG